MYVVFIFLNGSINHIFKNIYSEGEKTGQVEARVLRMYLVWNVNIRS